MEEKLKVKLISNAMAAGFTSNVTAYTIKEHTQYVNEVNRLADVLVRCEFLDNEEVKQIARSAFEYGCKQANSSASL